MVQVNVQREIARFVTQHAERLIAENVVEQAKRHILDTVGVILAGHTDPMSKVLLHFLDEIEDDGRYTVPGVSRTVSLTQAAFVNGVLSHALDYDDSSWRLIGHPSAVVLPAVMAVAEKWDVSGLELIKAYIIGTEVSCKIGAWVNPRLYEQGWHATSVVGVFGAAAGAGYLLKLNEDQMVHALGIAASSAGGVRRNFGTMTKPYHAGMAARNGLLAAWLAREGYQASPDALDGKMGYFTNYLHLDQVHEPAEFQFGKPFDVVSPGFFVKPYPSCAATHTAIDAALALVRTHAVNVEEIVRVDVGASPVVPLMLIHPRPKAPTEGKFSMPFVVAAALRDRKVDLDTFTERKIRDPGLQALMEKVNVFVDEEFEPLDITQSPVKIAVHLKDGRVYRERIDFPSGSPKNPMSLQALVDKFRNCAESVWDVRQIERVQSLLLELDRVPRVSELFRVLRNPDS